MAITKVITPDLIDLPFNNTDGIVLAKGTTTTTIDTTGTCSYPSTATALFQLNNNIVDTCGNHTAAWSGTAAYSSTAKFGSHSAEFSGGNGGTYINTGVDPDASSNWTVSVWVYRTNTSTFDWFFGTLGTGSSDGFGFSAYNQASNGQIDVYRGNIFGSYDRTRGGTSTFNEWNHFALTHDGSGSGTTTIYQNGALLTGLNLGTNPMTGTSTNDQNWCLASGGTFNNERLHGYIDQARFFNTELSATEIEQLYNETNINAAGRPSSPVNGEFRYNTTTKKVEYYDGAKWFALISTTSVPQAGTTGACNYPTTATALYQFDDNVADTCNNYNGTAYNLNAYVAGKFGKAASFNGTNSRVDITSPIGQNASNENDDFSVSLWVYWLSITGTAGGFNGALSGNGNGSSYSSFALYSYGNAAGISVALERYFNNTGYYSSGYLAAAPFAAVINTWYNLVFTYAGSTKTVTTYVDGTALPTYTLNTNAGSRTMNSLNSFGSYNGSSSGHNGYLDQFRIFPSVLTQEQVTALATETAP